MSSRYDDEQTDLHSAFELEGAERPPYLVLEAERMLALENAVRSALAASNATPQWQHIWDNTRPAPKAFMSIEFGVPARVAAPSLSIVMGKAARTVISDCVQKFSNWAGSQGPNAGRA